MGRCIRIESDVTVETVELFHVVVRFVDVGADGAAQGGRIPAHERAAAVAGS